MNVIITNDVICGVTIPSFITIVLIKDKQSKHSRGSIGFTVDYVSLKCLNAMEINFIL